MSRYGFHACPARFGFSASVGVCRVAKSVTAAEEEEANRSAPAAIVECSHCGHRAVLEGSNKHPRAMRVPDQSVFD